MAKKDAKPTSLEFTDVATGFYKNYNIKWLRGEPTHPDFNLVAEYDALHPQKEEDVEEVVEKAKKPEKVEETK